MNHRVYAAHRSRRVALFVGVVLFFVIIAALIVKFVLLIERSTFDGNHQFILQVNHPKTTDLLVFSPDTDHMTIVDLSSVTMSETIVKNLGIPVDGSIVDERTGSVKDIATDLLIHFQSLHPTITFLDALRLFFFIQGVPPASIKQDAVQLPANDSSSQQKIAKDFMDQTFYKENINIAIVNATGVSGLGNNVALLLSHIGANVISVTSSQTITTDSTIVYMGKQQTYTLQRLQNILHFPVQYSTDAGIADITITIGTNNAERFTP